MKRNETIIAILLVILGATARLFPHPANVAPIAGIALFSGLYLPRRYAFAIPLIAMFISDAVIGFYHWPMMLAVYAGFVMNVYFGALAKKQKTFSTIFAGTLIGSIIFFLLTNAAVWAFGTMYAKTIVGLMQSYTMAIPFFRNSLIGDFFFVYLLVGGMEFLTYIQKNKLPAHIS